MTRSSSLVYRTIVGLLVATLATACASGDKSHRVDHVTPGYVPAAGIQGYASQDRKMVRSARLAVSVDAPEETSSEVEHLVKQAGGFVERSTVTKDSNVSLHCRVPAPQLNQTMDAIAALGDEELRSVSAADVTEQYSDLETRLRNNLALRERLQQLLSRATDVEDVLAIEKELNRIQTNIETMQARFDRLKSEVELSPLSVTLERKRILGPLGYAGYRLWWAFSKLFVIR
jgi:hypothetical protein